jgi:hypothetical protein
MKTTTVPAAPSFVRSVAAVALHGTNEKAAEFARDRLGDPIAARWIERSLTSTEDIPVPQTTEFLAWIAPQTVLGRLTRARRVPFHSAAALVTSSAAFAWVTNGQAAPVKRMTAEPASLPRRTAAGIVALSSELLRGAPGTEEAIRDVLRNGLVEFLDTALLDPAADGSLAFGAPSSAATGDPAADLRGIVADAAGALGTLSGVVLVMSEAVAFAIATQVPGAFPAGVDGGLFGVVPVLLSAAAGTTVAAVHMPSVIYADDGEIEFESSRHAALEMSEAPSHDSATPNGAELVSMWQTNARALKVSRVLNFSAPHPGAVHVLTGADYLA